MKKPSFIERLTGSMSVDEYEDDMFDDEMSTPEQRKEPVYQEDTWQEREPAEPEEGELPIDMYQTGDDVVIRALIAGVSPSDLDISITRDMVTIRGIREELQEAGDDDYYHRELFWGSFARTILLPEEILIDEAEANEKHGLLEIRLPKVDKNRSTRLKVKLG